MADSPEKITILRQNINSIMKIQSEPKTKQREQVSKSSIKPPDLTSQIVEEEAKDDERMINPNPPTKDPTKETVTIYNEDGEKIGTGQYNPRTNNIKFIDDKIDENEAPKVPKTMFKEEEDIEAGDNDNPYNSKQSQKKEEKERLKEVTRINKEVTKKEQEKQKKKDEIEL